MAFIKFLHFSSYSKHSSKEAEIAKRDLDKRRQFCEDYKTSVLEGLAPLNPIFNGCLDEGIYTSLNFSIPGLDSEAFILAVKDLIAISNGSACTSQNYELSHVLKSMGINEELIEGAVRISWCHYDPIRRLVQYSQKITENSELKAKREAEASLFKN